MRSFWAASIVGRELGQVPQLPPSQVGLKQGSGRRRRSDVVDGKSHANRQSVPKEDVLIRTANTARDKVTAAQARDQRWHPDGGCCRCDTAAHGCHRWPRRHRGNALSVWRRCACMQCRRLVPADIVAPCAQDQCVCECNMVWGVGCRAQRTRRPRQVARNAACRPQAAPGWDSAPVSSTGAAGSICSFRSLSGAAEGKPVPRREVSGTHGLCQVSCTLCWQRPPSVLALFPLETISSIGFTCPWTV